ncbi:VWA domain-containing protein [Ferruginibacter sp. HRS2-29]|uniref:vWA domain-containing protein n=1 Tax=Ferruginibacter sp. HRS2-29 TaxID=2487334 RepID=UPI0020CC9720|nr:VWA domain-containing protein [Ferruginibacter sp. HRS2-29]MCP9751705.1 VWA domain-containing protein [Ferruginibacter sp. HRS2-29]
MVFDYFNNIQFAQPYFFGLFILLPLLITWYYLTNRKRSASITVSTTAAKGMGSWKATFIHLPFILRLLALSAIIVALARPQTRDEQQRAEGEGIDIILCIDVSGSMTAQDLTPNRLEAAKNVAIDFVNRRPTDRIGIVIFSGESFTQCPLTTDQSVLIAAIQNIRNGLLEDGTAIGSGLSTSVDRLRTGTSKSKVVVLLTDGENNGGLIDPKTAKEIAKTYGIKVYTIGVGTDGMAPQPENTPLGVVMKSQKVSIDEKLLTEIATETGGKYFRAKDNNSLSEIYTTIDGLEKSKVEITKTIRFQDKFFPLVMAAIFFLFMEVLFRYLVFRKFP